MTLKGPVVAELFGDPSGWGDYSPCTDAFIAARAVRFAEIEELLERLRKEERMRREQS